MKLNLHDAWDYLNNKAFDGELTKPPIMLYKDIKYKTVKEGVQELLGGYDPARGIYISAKGHEKVSDTLETLYHEMCHQYLHEMTDENPFQHGMAFCETYARGLEKLCL